MFEELNLGVVVVGVVGAVIVTVAVTVVVEVEAVVGWLVVDASTAVEPAWIVEAEGGAR